MEDSAGVRGPVERLALTSAHTPRAPYPAGAVW